MSEITASGGFDLVFQFREQAVGDILTRVLNASLSGHLDHDGPLKGHVDLGGKQRPQGKIWWEQPKLSLHAPDQIALALPLHGGLRQERDHKILNVEGEISATGALCVDFDPETGPYVRPNPGTFRFDADVNKETYTDSDGAAATPEADLQANALELLDKLVRPLLDLPVSYTLASLPALEDGQADRQADTPSRGLLVHRHVARVLSAGKEGKEKTLALALNIGGPGGVASQLGAVEFTGDERNVALVISSAGMNSLLKQLRHQRDQGEGAEAGPDAEDTGLWRELTVRFSDGLALLTGQWARGDETPRAVEARLACQIDATGQLEVEPRTSDAIRMNGANCSDQAQAAAIMRSWRLLLERLLRARFDPSDPDDDAKLSQQFILPGKTETTPLLAAAVRLVEDTLIVEYAVPAPLEPLPDLRPKRRPQVTIEQVGLTPTQRHPGDLVIARVRANVTTTSSTLVTRLLSWVAGLRSETLNSWIAKLDRGSYPPYEYSWTFDPPPQNPSDARDQVAETLLYQPPPLPAPGQRAKLMEARVKVTDMFGQHADASKQVYYRSSRMSDRVRQAVAAVTAAVLVLVGAVDLASHFVSSTPQFTVEITSPKNNASFFVEDAIQLTGSAIDPMTREELTPGRKWKGKDWTWIWLMDNSPIGQNATSLAYSFSKSTDQGTHTITLQVKNDSAVGTDQVRILVSLRPHLAILVAPSDQPYQCTGTSFPVMSVKNTGGSLLNWAVTSSDQTITVSPPNGTLDADAEQTLTFTSAQQHDKPWTLTFSAPYSNPASVPVTIDCRIIIG
jgi:hypothetical protein